LIGITDDAGLIVIVVFSITTSLNLSIKYADIVRVCLVANGTRTAALVTGVIRITWEAFAQRARRRRT
jgi:hypothetical protein